MTPPKYSENSQCRGKIGYRTKGFAKSKAKRMQSAVGGPGLMRAYHCPHCHMFHIGHDVPLEGKAAARIREIMQGMFSEEEKLRAEALRAIAE